VAAARPLLAAQLLQQLLVAATDNSHLHIRQQQSSSCIIGNSMRQLNAPELHDKQRQHNVVVTKLCCVVALSLLQG
jgi:hypothetical protein